MANVVLEPIDLYGNWKVTALQVPTARETVRAQEGEVEVQDQEQGIEARLDQEEERRLERNG